jgi:hypothetical protein
VSHAEAIQAAVPTAHAAEPWHQGRYGNALNALTVWLQADCSVGLMHKSGMDNRVGSNSNVHRQAGTGYDRCSAIVETTINIASGLFTGYLLL